MRNCVCILTTVPSSVWMKFLNKFTHYDVYMVCDRNSHDYHSLWGGEFSKVNFVQMVGAEPEKHGFKNLSSAIAPQQIVNSWDKAVYYFSKINTTYDNVWLIEDDVYFYSEKTLLDVDAAFTDSDLLTNVSIPKSDDMKSAWHWHWCLFDVKLPEESQYRAMVCAARISKALFSCITSYVKDNNTMFFLEAFFPSIAVHNNLKYSMPKEMSNIEYRHDWTSEDINNTHLFHPVKNMTAHIDNRLIERFS